MASPLRRWLERSGVVPFAIFAVAAAFTAYFSMYAFRKPFAAGEFTGEMFAGDLTLKTALLIFQVFGYALSKWLGIKYVSELKPKHRAIALIILIAIAHFALLLFAVVPTRAKVVAIFFNGVPLGAVWGLVFGFLEGRRVSEILGAGLSASYIVASGAVKSVGKYLVEDHNISEYWMPATVGLIFLPIFLVAVYALNQLPPPSADDEAARVKREPMYGKERWAFLCEFAPGLISLTALYFFLTAYRSFRDDFAVELWRELGWGDRPAILAWSELPIALGVMIALGALYLIKDNRKGLWFAHMMMMSGTLLVGVATVAFDFEIISGTMWMITVGLGLYLAYVPYGCVLFDRMIAALGVVATAVFMIYVTDAAGYVGSITVMLYRDFGAKEMEWLEFFRYFSYFTAAFCTVCFLFSARYFDRRSRAPTPEAFDDEKPDDSPAGAAGPAGAGGDGDR
jgi:hypothetical protein